MALTQPTFASTVRPVCLRHWGHDILLTRLHSKYSISGIALEWFYSYLTNRSQFSLIEGCRSQSRGLKCGVPQGSVLGPILFVLYTAQLASLRSRRRKG